MNLLRDLIFKAANAFAKIVCFGFLAALLLLTGLRIWLSSNWGQQMVKKQLNKSGLELQHLKFSGLFPNHLRAQKVRFETAMGEKSLRTLSDNVEMTWSLSKLALGKLSISKCTLSDLHCIIAPSKASYETKDPNAEFKLPPLLFRSIELKDLFIEDLIVSQLGQERHGSLTASGSLALWSPALMGRIELLPAKKSDQLSLPSLAFDVTADAKNAVLNGVFEPQLPGQKNSGPKSPLLATVSARCNTADLERFARKNSTPLALDISLDLKAQGSNEPDLLGIPALGKCLPLEATLKGKWLGKERFDVSIEQIAVKSVLGTAEGKGSIEKGEWSNCQLEMQVHRPISLPKPLQSIPASRGIARWSGPLDAPQISYSALPFGKSPEELASEYKLQLERYRKDPAKWLFGLMLEDRKESVQSGESEATLQRRQVATGELSVNWGNEPSIDFSARGILPTLSLIQECSIGGFFSLKSQLKIADADSPQQKSISVALRGQIAKVTAPMGCEAENAHLSAEGQFETGKLEDLASLDFLKSSSDWQLFCTRGNWGKKQVFGLKGEAQQSQNSADFQVSAQAIEFTDRADRLVEDLSADGRIQIDSATGHMQCAFRQLQMQIDGNDLKTANPLHLIKRDHEWELPDLQLSTGGGLLKAELKANEETLTAKVQAISMPLSLANSLFDTELKGEVNGQLQLIGQPGQPNVTGQLETSSAAYFQNGEFRPLDGKLSLMIDRDLTRINLATSFFKSPLLIEGHLPWQRSVKAPYFTLNSTAPHDLAISLKGDIEPLATLLLPVGQRAKGEMEIDLKTKISTSPSIEGSIAFKDAEFHFEKGQMHLRSINGQMRAEGQKLIWDKVTARDRDGGAVTLSGTAVLWPQFALQSDAELTSVSYTHADFVHGRVDGSIQWLINQADNHVRGNLKLIDAQIEIPDQLSLDVPPIAQGLHQRRERHQANRSKSLLDIELQIPPRVDISGRGLTSQWGGWLHLGGDMSDVQLQGILRLSKGIFTFGGKQFNIIDSHIYFGDKAHREASLNVVAEYPVDGATVRAIFRGNLKSPELTFESYPQLTLNEMLSRVLFDTPFNAINPLQAIQVADAALSISGNRFTPFGQFRRNIKLDQISLQMPDSEEKKYVLQVGKYLKNGVLVGVKQSIDSEGSDVLVGTQISLEKRLQKNFTIKIEAGYQSESTLSLLWKSDY